MVGALDQGVFGGSVAGVGAELGEVTAEEGGAAVGHGCVEVALVGDVVGVVVAPCIEVVGGRGVLEERSGGAVLAGHDDVLLPVVEHLDHNAAVEEYYCGVAFAAVRDVRCPLVECAGGGRVVEEEGRRVVLVRASDVVFPEVHGCVDDASLEAANGRLEGFPVCSVSEAVRQPAARAMRVLAEAT